MFEYSLQGCQKRLGSMYRYVSVYQNTNGCKKEIYSLWPLYATMHHGWFGSTECLFNRSWFDIALATGE